MTLTTRVDELNAPKKSVDSRGDSYDLAFETIHKNDGTIIGMMVRGEIVIFKDLIEQVSDHLSTNQIDVLKRIMEIE